MQHCALNVVVAAGEMVMLLPTKPFDQTMYPWLQPVAVSVTGLSKQMLPAEAEIVGVAGLPTVIVAEADGLLSQAPSLQVALYEVVAVGFT